MRQPFSMLRAAFYLLAFILCVEVLSVVIAGFGCFWLNMETKREIGACLPVTQVIREVFNEMLTAVLALLLAARNGKPPDPPPDG